MKLFRSEFSSSIYTGFIVGTLAAAVFFVGMLNGQTNAAVDNALVERLQGHILLQVESLGEAWYVKPGERKRYYLRDGAAAYNIMRFHSLGISNADLQKVLDGNATLLARLKGHILLQVEAHGEAYYICPRDMKVTYIKDGDVAYGVLRSCGLGITNADLALITVASDSVTPPNGVDLSVVSPFFSIEKRAFDLINSHRSSIGVAALAYNDDVARIARMHSEDMASGKLEPSHDGFEQRVEQMKSILSGYNGGAENLAWNYASDPAQTALTWWLGSAGHKASLEQSAYTVTGIGVARAADGKYYFTQLFANAEISSISKPTASSGTTLAGCPVFPADNPWNQDVSALSVHPQSATYINSIGLTRGLHPDFGSNPEYGIPYDIVEASQPLVPITFTAYGDESDPGPYPIPANAKVEGGSDHHVIVLQKESCKLFELFNAERDFSNGGWFADAGAVFDLRSNALRPQYWTSADAAGLAILPGLIRYEEAQAGAITHAIRFTASRTQRGFILPATHYAGSVDASLPPMGLRVRMKANYDISGLTGHSRVIAEAMKKYGMMLADNGSNWYFQGATDSRWDDDDLNQLKGIPGSAFEAVYTGEIIK